MFRRILKSGRLRTLFKSLPYLARNFWGLGFWDWHRVEGFFTELERRQLREEFERTESLPVIHPEAFLGIAKPVLLASAATEKGELKVAELATICGIAGWIGAKRVFEIGTAMGTTALHLAMNTPEDSKVFTLDIGDLALRCPSLPLTKRDLSNVPNERLGEAFRDTPYEGKIVQLVCDSAALDLGPYRESIDLVFIDGSHSYEYVKNDSQLAFEMLRPGGAVVWHDHSPIHPGVVRYIRELSRERSLYRIAGTELVIHSTKFDSLDSKTAKSASGGTTELL